MTIRFKCPVEVPTPKAAPRSKRIVGEHADAEVEGYEPDVEEGMGEHADAEVEGHESDVEEEMKVPQSDISSVLSELETDVEDVPSEGCADEAADDDVVPPVELPEPDADAAMVRKKPRGANTVAEHTNYYFTCTNDPKYCDVVMGIHSVWRKPEELGTSLFSKRVRPHHFGDGEGNPVRSYMVLRSWMLWRSLRNGWNTRKISREQWWQHEHDRLRRDIGALHVVGGGTGNSKADDMIRVWSPTVL